MWLTDLADTCRAAGLDVVEVLDWQHRGRGPMRGVATIVCHHTGGPAAGDAPSLRVVRDGRPDLPGPLAQLLLARSGRVHVVAAGLCNHAGATLDRRQANPWAVGIEAEATGVDPWRPVQMDAYVRLCAALCRRYGLGPDRVLGHKEIAKPLGRKRDPNLDMAGFRRAVAAELGIPTSRSDMSSEFESDVRAMFAGLAPGSLAALERDLRGDLAAKQAQLDRIEAKLDQLLADDGPRSVPLYPQEGVRGGNT